MLAGMHDNQPTFGQINGNKFRPAKSLLFGKIDCLRVIRLSEHGISMKGCTHKSHKQ